MKAVQKDYAESIPHSTVYDVLFGPKTCIRNEKPVAVEGSVRHHVAVIVTTCQEIIVIPVVDIFNGKRIYIYGSNADATVVSGKSARTNLDIE